MAAREHQDPLQRVDLDAQVMLRLHVSIDDRTATSIKTEQPPLLARFA